MSAEPVDSDIQGGTDGHSGNCLEMPEWHGASEHVPRTSMVRDVMLLLSGMTKQAYGREMVARETLRPVAVADKPKAARSRIGFDDARDLVRSPNTCFRGYPVSMPAPRRRWRRSSSISAN